MPKFTFSFLDQGKAGAAPQTGFSTRDAVFFSNRPEECFSEADLREAFSAASRTLKDALEQLPEPIKP